MDTPLKSILNRQEFRRVPSHQCLMCDASYLLADGCIMVLGDHSSIFSPYG